jgi:hypothetical protein
MKAGRNALSAVIAAALAVGLAVPAQAATVVYSNGAAPGDSYTNATTSNQGQAVGASGWYYNNVRNSGVVGINATYPRNGTGSAYLETQFGPGGASSKADIEYLAGGVNFNGNYVASGTLGLFSAFSAMSYEWYRDSTSTNSSAQHPALRVLLDRDGNLVTTGDRGGLVYEGSYNGAPVAPVDTWTAGSVGAATKLWNFGLGLGFEFDIDGDGSPYDTLAEWQASQLMSNAVILGFSAGVGSGWGPFMGAVDNIGWTIDGQSGSYNFEVPRDQGVPEPASMALVGIGLLALARTRRRSR